MSGSHSAFLNKDDEDELRLFGYATSLTRKLLLFILIFLSGGILLLLFVWKPHMKHTLTAKNCAFHTADFLLVYDKYGNVNVVKILRVSERVYFEYKKIKYCWKNDVAEFQKVCGDTGLSKKKIRSMSRGLNETQAAQNLEHFGLNTIYVELRPVWSLIFEEVSSPFYVYQMFIVVVWLVQDYYQFAVCIFMFSAISIWMHVFESRKQIMLLQQQVQSESRVKVLRASKVEDISSIDLVPGDLILLVPGQAFTMECDAVIVSGGCTVDESMLTGESVPVSKVCFLDGGDDVYDVTRSNKSTLFCGTSVLNVVSTKNAPVKALVLRTGYTTAKGELVRSILFPAAVNFKLKQDYVKCMFTFFLVGIPCMIYTACVFSDLHAKTKDIIITVVDVATFLCPPLLPAIMTSINAHAQRRLRKKGIFCLNPNYINFAGGLDVVCFDKTGTLTDDSIEFSGVLPLTESFTFIDPQKLVTEIPTDSCISLVMGCCHSIVKINDVIDGDSLELQLFNHLGWELQPDQNENGVLFAVFPADSTKKFSIHRQFPFESRLQRMTTIVRSNDDDAFVATMKGAPEVVVALCDAASVPRDWHKVLDTFTRQGCRVLGTATRVLSHVSSLEDLMNTPRNLLESELEFAGFLVFQNKLKPETAPTIHVLKSVDIRTVMVTGDNVLTAISVGRSSGMVGEANAIVHVEAKLTDLRLDITLKIEGLSGFDPLPDDWQGMDASLTGFPLSIEGQSFDVLRENDPVLFEKVVHKGVIFARMTPDQKLHLVTELQRQGHQVGMCGDGANDCGALRASNSGISLSTAEASVASPFTYARKNIECFPLLIMEGRGTLSASFGAFKYQACYCFTLLAAVMVLFWDGQKPSDMGYVFIDIILNILPPLMFGTTEPSDKLTKQRPQKSLFSFSPLFSIFSFVFIQVGVYLTGRSYLLSQSWYDPFEFNATTIHHPEPSHMQLTIISLNCMSYVITAILFAVGPPFRKGIHSNRLYMIVIFFNLILTIMVTLYPAPRFALRFLNFKDAPDQFRIMLFFVSLGNFLLCMIWEVVFIQNILTEVIMKKVRKMRGDIHLHEKIESDILKNGLTKGGPLSNAHVSILIDDTDSFRSSKRKKDYYPKMRLESEESVEPLKLNPVPAHYKKNKRLLEVSRL